MRGVERSVVRVAKVADRSRAVKARTREQHGVATRAPMTGVRVQWTDRAGSERPPHPRPLSPAARGRGETFVPQAKLCPSRNLMTDIRRTPRHLPVTDPSAQAGITFS